MVVLVDRHEIEWRAAPRVCRAQCVDPGRTSCREVRIRADEVLFRDSAAGPISDMQPCMAGLILVTLNFPGVLILNTQILRKGISKE